MGRTSGLLHTFVGLSLVSFQACASVQETTVRHPYPRSSADIPVSLQVGTVRTDEFPVIKEAYFIMLQAEKRLPFGDLQCMLGLKGHHQPCANKPLVEGSWTVRDAGTKTVVSEGSFSGEGDAIYTSAYVVRFLGQFMGEAGKKYVLEVKFTKDGSALGGTNPHLVVVLVRYH